MRRSLLPQLPAILWAAAVFVLLTLPESSVPTVYFWTFGIDSDKFAHGVLFFVQALLLYPALVARRRASILTRHPVLFSALIATVYGGLMECVQAALPDRSASMMDLLADVAGASLFVVLWVIGLRHVISKWLRYRMKRIPEPGSRGT